MNRLIQGLLFGLLLWASPVEAANRFLTCNTTCTITPSDTTIWGTTTGGTGASVPGSSDAVILDANTCVGGTTCTATLNFGGTWTIQAFTMNACTASTTGCIFDNSVNNNNITITNTSSAFNNSGSGVRTLRLGTATYTMSGSSVTWTQATTTNLTFSGASATLSFTGSGSKTMNPGSGTTYGTINVSGSTTSRIEFTQSFTIGTFNVTAPNFIGMDQGDILTITNPVNFVGSQGSVITIVPSVYNGSTYGFVASGTMTWVALRGMILTGSIATSNCMYLGDLTGISCEFAKINGVFGQ